MDIKWAQPDPLTSSIKVVQVGRSKSLRAQKAEAEPPLVSGLYNRMARGVLRLSGYKLAQVERSEAASLRHTKVFWAISATLNQLQQHEMLTNQRVQKKEAVWSDTCEVFFNNSSNLGCREDKVEEHKVTSANCFKAELLMTSAPKVSHSEQIT